MPEIRKHNLIDLGVLVAVGTVALFTIEVWPSHAASVIAALGTLQLIRFLWSTFKRVHRHLNHEGSSMLHCLVLLGAMLVYFMFVYGVEYALLAAADAGALKNFTTASRWWSLIDGWYFSTVTFNATGFEEIVPVGFPAKVLVWGQMILGYATPVFAISSFISLTNKSGDD